MAEQTKIEWCDHTFNPWLGCTKISPACDHCYAETWVKRFGMVQWGPHAARRRTSAAYWRMPKKWNRQTEIQFSAWARFQADNGVSDDEMIERHGFIKPQRPRVFCGSLCDVFDNAVPEEWRADLFMLIAKTPYLDWLLLTKRIGNAYTMIQRAMWQMGYHPGMHHSLPANVWLGITVCAQTEADRDIPKLLAVPAAKRFLSLEPLLGPADLRSLTLNGGSGFDALTGGPVSGDDWPGVDWVIVGGESGPHARPMHPDWLRSIRDQCAEAGVPFMFKQWGEWEVASVANGHHDCDMARNGAIWLDQDGTTASPSSNGLSDNAYAMMKVGKKKAGRVLDGKLHDAFPERAP